MNPWEDMKPTTRGIYFEQEVYGAEILTPTVHGELEPKNPGSIRSFDDFRPSAENTDHWTATSVKSLDLNGQSYQQEGAVFGRVAQYIEEELCAAHGVPPDLYPYMANSEQQPDESLRWRQLDACRETGAVVDYSQIHNLDMAIFIPPGASEQQQAEMRDAQGLAEHYTVRLGYITYGDDTGQN